MNNFNFVRNNWIFLFVSFTLWFPHFIYLPVLTPYMELLGSEYIFIGIVLSSYGLMQFLFRLPIGIYSDLIKLRKPFMIFGLLIGSISCAVFAVTDSLGWILFGRTLAGIAAATWVVFTVLYSSYFAEDEVHRAMSSISFIVVLAQLLGMSVSGFIVDHLGWKAPFWIGAIISGIGAFLSLVIYEPTQTTNTKPIHLKELAILMKEPVILKVSFLSILAHSIIFTTMFGFIPAYVIEIGYDPRDISYFVFSFMIPHAIATLFMGKYFIPLIGKWNSLKIAFLSTAFFTLITPFVESKFLLAIVQGFNGFALGLLFPLLLGMAIETIDSYKRATAMGVYQALYAIGMFTGPLLAGFLNSSFGISAGFYFTGILGIVASFFSVLWGSNKNAEISKEH
ncbi:MFS transporter [Metabacillus litoralis]|uniref:MFS transporter n=1 Tax=Metabacillus litoralis TaxID=152268 RepID=UPI001BA36B80|nr:MFS transporter [Metabacillus litoralis]UHA60069.1 MFS transporter [Metabacillus litoralis]